MELDLSKLNNLRDSTAPKKKSPPETGGSGQATSQLQREADKIKHERDRAVNVYRHYQGNIKKAERLQADILKGAHRGENIYRLFLKAVRAISLMTDNTVFYNQIYKDIAEQYPEEIKAEVKTTENHR